MARLHRRAQVVGHVLMLTDHFTTQLGGHLWWRSWSRFRETLTPRVKLTDGTEFDQPLDPADLDAELQHFRRGHFPLLGELLQLEWLDPQQALIEAPTVFAAVGHVTEPGQIEWSFPHG